jgi:hypothetical protein
VNFDHLNGADPAELDRWQAEQRQQAVQRGWQGAINASGILGNPRPDSRSSPKAAQSWSTAFERADVTSRNGASSTAVNGKPTAAAATSSSKSWNDAFRAAGITTNPSLVRQTSGQRPTSGGGGRRLVPTSRRRE